MSKPNRKVIRLQQMRAQIAEAAGIKYVDLVFEVPGSLPETSEERVCSFLTQDFWPVEVIRSVEEDGENANLDVLRKVASPPEAFDELVKTAQLTVGELKELIEELSKEAGTEQGEGSGSSSSSTSTQEPSAPTSSATTPAVA
ncbi:hypothetical protein JL475_00540 [Streptomyces sp. M2CJ-2]|uniref:hypothetical protein n=1 Tax=Streptomyces sp. M2CJ-2 TaxID=2803948 RepID=UPI0019211BD3|nr:hypothetical protein [Streptomyces sp. M2CJ-2]MBL3664534.1 hypothetical protein [Streptomyces sp. M2CJ-2]